MDDDLKQIELQQAKIRLEREQLLLENERARHRRAERATEVVQSAVDVTKEAGEVVAWGAAMLIKFVIGTVITITKYGLAALLIIAIFVAMMDPGNFMWRFGFVLANGAWKMVALFCFLGLISAITPSGNKNV